MTAARGQGLAEKDFAAVFAVLARRSGLPGSQAALLQAVMDAGRAPA